MPQRHPTFADELKSPFLATLLEPIQTARRLGKDDAILVLELAGTLGPDRRRRMAQELRQSAAVFANSGAVVRATRLLATAAEYAAGTA
jgi:hypothetical protein